MKIIIILFFVSLAFLSIGGCGNKDSYPPGININSPNFGQSYQKGDVITLNVLISDNSNIKDYTVILYNNTLMKEDWVIKNEVGKKQVKVESSWQITTSDKTNYTLRIDAIDENGNKANEVMPLYAN